MKNNKTKMTVLFLVSFLFLFHSSPEIGYACSCVKPGSAKEEMERSSAVFAGKVIEITDENKNKQVMSSADPLAVLIEVEEAWKGINKTQVVVYTERSSASCGYGFELNQEYIVYADESDGKLKVSLCSRTAPLSEAEEDIHELGKGEKPTEQTVIDLETKEQTIMDTFIGDNIIAIGSLIAIGMAAFVYRLRRMKK